MNKWILLILISAALFSCGKRDEQSSDQSEKQAIIDALNSGDSERAESLPLAAIETYPTDPEYKYYLAQAYSQKAEIDIYTLFPLVKMQVFDLAISEWQQAREYDKRQSQSVDLALVGSDKDTSVGRGERIEAQSLLIKELDMTEVEIDFHVSFVYCYGNEQEYDEETQNYIDINYNCYYDIIYTSENEYFRGHSVDSGFSIIAEKQLTEQEIKDSHTFDEKYIKETLRAKTIKELQKKKNSLEEKRMMQKYIKAMYALFDSIPILKAVPLVNYENMDYLFSSIELLENLISESEEDSRVQKNSIQQLGLLGGYLVTYGIKSSVELENVSEPLDLICKAKPILIIENYPYIRAGLKSLLNVTIYTDFYKKNQDNLDKAKEYMKLLPDELTDEQKAEYIEDIEEFQEDNC